MEKKDILIELEQYQLFLEQAPTDDADVLARRLAELNTIIARTGLLLAEAKKILNDKMKKVMDENFIEISQLSATVGKMYAEAQCSDEVKLVTWVERLNRSSVHVSDNLRTLISLAKENLRLIKNGY